MGSSLKAGDAARANDSGLTLHYEGESGYQQARNRWRGIRMTDDPAGLIGPARIGGTGIFAGRKLEV